MKTTTLDTDQFTILGAFSVQAPKTGLCGGSVLRTAAHPSNPLRTNRERLRRKDRRVLRAPVGLNLRKTGFGGTPCRLDTNNTLNVSRAALGAPNPLRTNRGQTLRVCFVHVAKQNAGLVSTGACAGISRVSGLFCTSRLSLWGRF
jgi:hypothetical protein